MKLLEYFSGGKNYSGLEVNVDIEQVNCGTDKLIVNMSLPAQQFNKEISVFIPRFIDRRYVTYQGHIYGNIMYGIPDSKFYVSYLNGLCCEVQPHEKLGALGYINNMEGLADPELLVNPVMKAAWSSIGTLSENIYDMNEWSYVRASDILEEALIVSIENTARAAVKQNIYSNWMIKRAISIGTLAFRWISHSIEFDEFKINDMASRVIIPEIFTSLEDANIIKCDILDFSDVSQGATFNIFALKKGVLENEINRRS